MNAKIAIALIVIVVGVAVLAILLDQRQRYRQAHTQTIYTTPGYEIDGPRDIRESFAIEDCEEVTIAFAIFRPDIIVELRNPAGAVVHSVTALDSRTPFQKFSDMVSGNSRIYTANLTLRTPEVGIWELSLLNATSGREVFDLTVECITNTQLRVVDLNTTIDEGERNIDAVLSLEQAGVSKCDTELSVRAMNGALIEIPPYTVTRSYDCKLHLQVGPITYLNFQIYVTATNGSVQREVILR